MRLGRYTKAESLALELLKSAAAAKDAGEHLCLTGRACQCMKRASPPQFCHII